MMEDEQGQLLSFPLLNRWLDAFDPLRSRAEERLYLWVEAFRGVGEDPTQWRIYIWKKSLILLGESTCNSGVGAGGFRVEIRCTVTRKGAASRKLKLVLKITFTLKSRVGSYREACGAGACG